MPESETDPILESRDNLETRREAKVGPRRVSPGPLLEIWREQGEAKGNSSSVKFLIVVRYFYHAVVDLAAPRGSCEMMIWSTCQTARQLKIPPVEIGSGARGKFAYPVRALNNFQTRRSGLRFSFEDC